MALQAAKHGENSGVEAWLCHEAVHAQVLPHRQDVAVEALALVSRIQQFSCLALATVILHRRQHATMVSIIEKVVVFENLWRKKGSKWRRKAAVIRLKSWPLIFLNPN